MAIDWLAEASRRDQEDPLAWLPDQFHVPPNTLYFDGNSLGLLCKAAEARIQQTLHDWARLGVMGWNQAEPPWFTWVETLGAQIGQLTGAMPGEITLGASTTVMLHQLLATLYRNQDGRQRILMDESAFPTDRYAVHSFLSGRGLDADAVVTVPADPERLIRPESILAQATDDVALAVLPSVIFTTGQALPMAELTERLRARHIPIIWDLSHSVGLLPHHLHQEHIEAAVFCTYKYLNGGPGAPGGAFIHQDLWPVQPGLKGWWGSANDRQFAMTDTFHGAPDAHALQLGTPSILALAPLAGSLDLLCSLGIDALHQRSQGLIAFLETMVDEVLRPHGIGLATPRQNRGGHLALTHPQAQAISLALRDRQVVPDFRHPDIIRLAPVPTSTRYQDCARVVSLIDEVLSTNAWHPYRAVRPEVL